MIKLYYFYSSSHEEMKNEYFLSSMQNEYDCIGIKTKQKCKTGEYRTKGWNEVVIQKIDLIIRAINENKNSWFVHSDVDVQFFDSTKNNLEYHLRNNDTVFQSDGENPNPIACAGFFASKANDKTLKLWKSVKKLCQIKQIDDQQALNICLQNNDFVKWKLLPTEYFSIGGNLKNNSKYRWKPNDDINFPMKIKIHHANYTEGIDNKIKQLEFVKNKFNNQQNQER